MTRALRVISVQRGIDPRAFTLASFGGAGGLHVCALADSLEMARAMVPVHAGVLSALGMLAAGSGRQLSRAWPGLLDSMGEDEIQRQLDGLAAGGVASLVAEGVAEGKLRRDYSLDLRYQGQSYTLNVPWVDIPGALEAFTHRHRSRYGHHMAVPVELVNLRVGLTAPGARFALSRVSKDRSAKPFSRVKVYGIDGGVPVLRREDLRAGQRFAGPALITETVATTWLAPGWGCEVDGVGNLLLRKQDSYKISL
jgi:N-methylhydantoinase A